MKLAHLQGLRAVAIVSVALFHFFPHVFPNGYLGVDQFFLLSGYLMTMMLSRSDRLGTSEIGEFLYRRLRRITPLYYLITLLILISLKCAPPISWDINQNSAPKALTFTINIVKPAEGDGYFEKLGLAVDMFTHTWSLAVEVQFYLIFPFFFVVYCNTPEKGRNLVFLLAVISSLFLYFFSDEFYSFGNVFCRIWQFLAGMAVFNLSQSPKTDDLPEKVSLLELSEPDTSRTNSLLVNGCLFSMLALLLWKTPIDPNFGRVNIIVLTAIIVHLAHGVWLLENKLSVFIGEISYCWYLIHWPVVAHLMLNNMKSTNDLLNGLLYSFIVSCVIHVLYEKHYLSWSKKVISAVVIVLLIGNFAVLQITRTDSGNTSVFALFSNASRIGNVENNQNITRSYVNNSASSRNGTVTASFDRYFYPSDTYKYPKFSYENMTNDEKIKFHQAFDKNDGAQTQEYIKTWIGDPVDKRLYHYPGGTNSSNLKFMVIGNSVAQNTIGLVQQECEHKFNSLHIAAAGGCEPLVRSLLKGYAGFNCSIDTFMMEAVRKVKPDVLFMIYRHIDTMLIEKGTNPFDDKNFKTAVERLKEYEDLVSTRIYLVDPWAETSTSFTKSLIAFLQTGSKFDEKSLVDMSSQRVLVAKQRMARLVNECKKCQIFDFATMFYIDGKYTMYDPKHYVSFVTSGRHFSPAGLERIRPLFKDLCDRV